VEFPELDSWGKADVTKIKAYVASTSDYFRGSYDKRAKEHPRQLVFGGTTNEDHYLTDATGNRRFWPVRVTRRCDIDWLQAHRDQLFAEAFVRWREGRRMYPTDDEERELFAPQQRERAVDNPIESALWRYFHHNEAGIGVAEVSLVEALGKIGIGVEKLSPGRFHEKQAAAALRRLGWTEKRSSKPGRPRVYCRPDAEGEAVPRAAERTQRADAGASTRADDDCPF
jgi:predicted P-loop ATPase